MQKSEKSHTDSARDSVLTRAVSWEHAFLDFIVNWVNDPTSERSLILFGQAGTGKSSIAYEAMRSHVFDKMHHLPEGTAQTGGLSLLTALAHRYPSFKTALREVVKKNTILRVGTRSYDALFEFLILEPLTDLPVVRPILVVIEPSPVLRTPVR